MAQSLSSATSASPPPAPSSSSKPIQVPVSGLQMLNIAKSPQGVQGFRNGHLNLNTFSPVNEHGSFEFDRVLKRGKVNGKIKSRHAFKASWKPVYLVLRPNLLSVYKDEDEAELRQSVTLSEVTAVIAIKSPRSSRENVFGVFSPSKNYRFQAPSRRDADDWIERIRAEARIDEEDEALLAQSKRNGGGTSDVDEQLGIMSEQSDVEQDAARPGSSELYRTVSFGAAARNLPLSQDYSGNDVTEYSDLSDGPAELAHLRSSTSAPRGPERATVPVANAPESRPSVARDTSRAANDIAMITDSERVVYHGYLQCLRSKRGVRQWRKVWVVLRHTSLALYKDEKEYRAIRIIPMSQAINAAEIDPISRSKQFCLQLITEDRPYRFCAPDEESLAKWIGAMKSIIVARRKSREKAGPS